MVAQCLVHLAHPLRIQGNVIEGNKLGRKLSYPTANLQIQDPDKLVPANGVYAVEAQIEGETRMLKGMMNIGNRPTVDGTRRSVEVHLFDFDEDIYNRHLKVHVRFHLRNEVKFESLEKLVQQLHKDKEISIGFVSPFFTQLYIPAFFFIQMTNNTLPKMNT